MDFRCMLSHGITISGKILVATDGDPFDSTRQLALWSVVPAEEAAAAAEGVTHIEIE